MTQLIKYICCTLLLVNVVGLNACKKSEVPPPPHPSNFEAVLENNDIVPVIGGMANILITAGADGWWIEVPEEASWCAISRKYGSGDVSVPVTLAPNNSGTSRKVTVTVNPTFGLPPVTLEINQE